ncbi:MAG: 4Fe-4S binding protein [Clostridiales bacterium]|uniref:4Fe-4S binding protein n=1 Tax=Evtepia sp. TaxID=2773933 RepID=UPI0029851F6F|nr:4Fe-4S binding protein [Evtepia sp.]MDD7289263.1 4Fe-4S binding protein [Clostridiales bacterium]MDY3993616.1 4Fe-4S binding protein [Evtepia sp.]MDY4430576.1 4Fe-4S binding protein [Evtepia sp.]
MKIQTVWAAYFSATDTTKKVVTRIARRLADQSGAPLQTFDFTLPQVRREPKQFGEGDLVVFGTPVYAGRVPNLLIKYVASVQGNGALAVPVVCYGNRNYDDALMELSLTLEAGGFTTLAAAAFSCQHAFSRTQAAGRPDTSDLTIAGGFADQVWKKGEADGPISAKVKGSNPVGPYYTPRDRHGNPINILKVKPRTTEDCTNCGLCARQCPLGSINPENAREMTGPCMKCNRCVRHCPKGAKYFDDPNYLYHKTELEEQFSWPRKEPELFW